MKLRQLLSCLFLLASTSAAAQLDLRNPQQAIEAGHAALREDAYRQAENILEQALLANADNADLHRHLGIAYYKSGRYDDALARLNRALELGPDDAENHYALGVVYLAQASELSALRVRGTMRNAIQHFEGAIAKAPEHVEAHYYLVQILIRAPALAGGDKRRAAELNAELKELAPLYHRVVNSSLAAMEDDPERAEQLLMEAHGKAPDSTLLNYSLLTHYHARNRCEEAILYGEHFLAAEREWDDSSPADAHVLIAECQRGLGNQEQSLQHYALALVHSKSDKVVRRVQGAVREMAQEQEQEQEQEND